MPLRPTMRQARFLLSDNTPLTPAQKKRFMQELHSGTAKIRKKKGK